MMTSRTTALAGTATSLAMAALIGVASPANAQSMDGPWLALTGCWIEAGAPLDAPMTCVVPEADGAVLLTVADGEVTERQVLRSDGVERPVDSGGCEGVQSAELSRTGTRVFTQARLTCDGGTERTTRGIMAMVAPDAWVQVRALTVGQGSVSWLTRYQPAPPSRVNAAPLAELDAAMEDRATAIETARFTAAAKMTVDDIIEAHARTDAEAVRSWIVEQGTPLELDADGLIRLADAGVSESVIDVAVAVSYPERFELAREPQGGASERDRAGYGRYGADAWRYGPGFYYDPFYYGYSRYGYRYDRWRYDRGYRSPTVIVVRPSGSASSGGRAVKGRGYTRTGGSASKGKAQPSSSNIGRGSSSGSSQAGSGYTRSGSSSSSSKGKAKSKSGGGN